MEPSTQSGAARSRLARSRFVRDAVVATASLGFLYAVVPHSGLRALQIPGYLLIVRFDILEGVFGAVHSYFDVVFWLYIVGLGAGLTVAAAIVLIFAGIVFSGTAQSEPVRILLGTVMVLLLLAALLADVFGVSKRLQAP